MGDRLSRGIFATALGASLIAAATAFAAVGDIAAEDCIDDNDDGFIGCAQSADGLRGAGALAISPDGKSVYVVGDLDDAVVHLSRDPGSGALTAVGCVADNDSSAETCAQSTNGLTVPRGVAVSPDGKSVYVVSVQDAAVVQFDRSPATGALTPVGCVDDLGDGEDACAASTNALGGAYSVVVSPDSKSVYVASIHDDALVRFDRDTGDGSLTAKGCIDDNDTGADVCAQSADGLDVAPHPGALGISPDGSSVYVSSAADSAVAMFGRETAGAPDDTGELTPLGCIEDNDTGPDGCTTSTNGLGRPQGLDVSPDGKSVYVSSGQNSNGGRDDAIVQFDRNLVSGILTPVGCIDDPVGADDCAQSAPLRFVEDVAVSPDGRSLYAANVLNTGAPVTHFDRTVAGGDLSFIDCISWIDPFDPCTTAADWTISTTALAVEPGGDDVYVVDVGSGLVGQLSRGDVTPPTTEIESGPEGPTDDPTPTFGFTANEAGSTFECRLDAASFSACTSPHTTASLAGGEHVFDVRATDPQGNTGDPASRSFAVELGPSAACTKATSALADAKRKQVKAKKKLKKAKAAVKKAKKKSGSASKLKKAKKKLKKAKAAAKRAKADVKAAGAAVETACG